jgi:hypothetical protein
VKRAATTRTARSPTPLARRSVCRVMTRLVVAAHELADAVVVAG